MTPVAERKEKTLLFPERLSGVRFEGRDFTGADLEKKDLSKSKFINCCFDKANMTEANCTGSDFTGSSFRKTRCYFTNFTLARLGNTIFEPYDCYGMTITMSCKTFQGATMSQMWFYAWLMFATSFKPTPNAPVKGDLVASLIYMIGTERYLKLKALFARNL